MLYSSSSCAWSPWSPLLRCRGWRASEKRSHTRFIPTFVVALSVTFTLWQTYHWNCGVLFAQPSSPSKPFGHFFHAAPQSHDSLENFRKGCSSHAAIVFVKYFSPPIIQASPLTPECWCECTIHTGVEWMQLLCCFLRNQSWFVFTILCYGSFFFILLKNHHWWKL